MPPPAPPPPPTPLLQILHALFILATATCDATLAGAQYCYCNCCWEPQSGLFGKTWSARSIRAHADKYPFSKFHDFRRFLARHAAELLEVIRRKGAAGEQPAAIVACEEQLIAEARAEFLDNDDASNSDGASFNGGLFGGFFDDEHAGPRGSSSESDGPAGGDGSCLIILFTNYYLNNTLYL
jgi:hypothetical protein